MLSHFQKAVTDLYCPSLTGARHGDRECKRKYSVICHEPHATNLLLGIRVDFDIKKTYGNSLWGRTAKIVGRLPDGKLEVYFHKVRR